MENTQIDRGKIIITQEPENNYIVPNLDRACSVLEYLSEQGTPCSLSDIARVLDMPKNSVFRILYTLERRDFVRQVGSEYQISSKLLTLGHSIVSGSTLLEKALPSLRELRDETRETVGFGVLTRKMEGVVLEQIPGLEPIKIQIDIGYNFPLHTSAPGKALIAFLTEERQREIVDTIKFEKLTQNTILSPDAYYHELADVRVLGYAMDREEQVDHVICIGAPVFNHENDTVAAVWITGPVFRIDSDRVFKLAPCVMTAAKKISLRLGFAQDL